MPYKDIEQKRQHEREHKRNLSKELSAQREDIKALHAMIVKMQQDSVKMRQDIYDVHSILSFDQMRINELIAASLLAKPRIPNIISAGDAAAERFASLRLDSLASVDEGA